MACDGVVRPPHLVQGVLDPKSGQVKDLDQLDRAPLPVQPETLHVIKEALLGVVNYGTAPKAKSMLVSIAGKTGTAQSAGMRPGPGHEVPKKFRDHAWFVSYAPTESPEIAVAVLVEHMGHGGSAAAPLAKEIIEAYVASHPVVAQAGPPADGRRGPR